ncbi:phospholipase D-like domain-containing protein [Peribacillus frigoritolerans]|uniref:phospholipase D-like domain-containing protein n=1 Tax=Peribacillus frigoritolerans TaxID=450367 RepID=UPI003F868DE2
MKLSKLIKNSNFTIVFNHHEEQTRTFQEVIDAFDSAKYIYVSSFGVTISVYNPKNKLFEELVKQSRLKPVKVITSIREGKEGKKSRDEINWKKTLDKKRMKEIDDKFLAYFCLRNHSKVILTDKIAYIGSENYTEFDGKNKNHEVGIVSRDSELIQFLKERLDYIITYSYREFEIDKYYQMRKFINFLNDIQESIIENSFELSNLLFDYYPSDNNELFDEEYATYDFKSKDLERFAKNVKGLINKLYSLLQQHLKKDELIPPFDLENPRSKSQIINESNILTHITDLKNCFENVKEIIKLAKKLKELDQYESDFREEETDIDFWREVIDPVRIFEHDGQEFTDVKSDTDILNEAIEIQANDYVNKMKEYDKMRKDYSLEIYKIKHDYEALEKALSNLITNLSAGS